MRIEFTERYCDMTDEEIDSATNLGKPLEYKYRRVYFRLKDISHPAEIPGKKSHCKIVFYDWGEIIIKGSYDTICQLIDDREQLDEERILKELKDDEEKE
jgi:hypothetical protein